MSVKNVMITNAIGVAKYDFSSLPAMASTLLIDTLRGGDRRLLFLFLGRQVEEHVLEAHPHLAQLEQSPSAIDDGGGDLATHISPLFPMNLERADGAGHACEIDA